MHTLLGEGGGGGADNKLPLPFLAFIFTIAVIFPVASRFEFAGCCGKFAELGPKILVVV